MEQTELLWSNPPIMSCGFFPLSSQDGPLLWDPGGLDEILQSIPGSRDTKLWEKQGPATSQGLYVCLRDKGKSRHKYLPWATPEEKTQVSHKVSLGR